MLNQTKSNDVSEHIYDTGHQTCNIRLGTRHVISAYSLMLNKGRIGYPRPNPGQETNKKNLVKRECEEFEMAVQHKSELRV